MGEILVDGDILAGRCLTHVAIYPPGRYTECLKVTALIDTGAMSTAISAPLANFAGLQVVGRTFVMGSGHSRVAHQYVTDLEWWGPGFKPSAAHVVRGAVVAELLSPIVGIHMLIGMDLLDGATTLLTPDNRWKITFPPRD